MAKDRGFITKRMKELRVPQKVIADAWGVTKSTVSKKLDGTHEIRASELAILAQLLRTDMSEIASALGIRTDQSERRMHVSMQVIEDGTVIPLPKEEAETLVTPRPEGMMNGLAMRVDTMALQPRYRPGEILFIASEAGDPADQIAYDCLVETEDGQMLIRNLHPAGNGIFLLMRLGDGKVSERTKLKSAAPIVWHRPFVRMPAA